MKKTAHSRNSDSLKARYLDTLRKPESPLMAAARKSAIELGAGDISLSPHEATLLRYFVTQNGCKKFVEVGTLTGLSAIAIFGALPEGGVLWTFEKDEVRAQRAKEIFSKLEQGMTPERRELPNGKTIWTFHAVKSQKTVHLVVDDAEISLFFISQEGPFDGVFIDGNKAAYVNYLDWAEKNLTLNGILIADNVFLGSAVWAGKSDRFSELQIQVMQEFNKRLTQSERFSTILIPTDEGMLLARKLASLVFVFLISMFLSISGVAEEGRKKPEAANGLLSQQCLTALKKFPGKWEEERVRASCYKVAQLDGCESVERIPIYHYDRMSSNSKASRILVFGMIHGDEGPAGSLARFWMQRLEELDPRNHWRIVPVLNPDGVKYKTRTNANKVDLNRNFPTRDWKDKALFEWKTKAASHPRRFPGSEAGSEPEVACALKHLEMFQPDFVISVHTPLRVLDFDGPRFKPPSFEYLPWRSLGHYPGSLGRYLWFERQTPVLTMELTGGAPSSLVAYENLQDLIGGMVKMELGKRPREISALHPSSPTEGD